jgi:PAS domain S-box-containing protein
LTATARRTQRTALVIVGLAVVGLCIEAALTLAKIDASGPLDTPTTVLYDVIVVAAAVVCALRACSRRAERIAWGLMAVALGFWALGELYADIFLANAGGTGAVPIPSVADGFWLAFYIPAYLSLIMLIRLRLPQLSASLLLDGVIGALGVGSLSAAVVFNTVLEHASGDFGVVATGLAYPIGDLILLSLLIGVAVASRRVPLGWSWWLLGGGFAVFCFGDSIYLIETANHTYIAGGLLDLTWPLALILIACAAWAPHRRQSELQSEPASIATPVALSMLALGLLIFDHFQRTNLLALVLAALCMVAVALRLVSAFRDAGNTARATAEERDQAIGQFASSELRYRSLFEQNPQPMLAYERSTLQIVAVSNATVNAYGYSREEFLSMTLRDLTPPEDAEILAVHFSVGDGARQSGPSGPRPWRHQRKDGTIVDVEITSDDLTLDGRKCRIVLAQNVTERNRASAELAIARDTAVEASNVKSAFLATLSHEIRTPMNGVIGMNELLLQTELDAAQQSYAEQVARSGEHMMTLINDILDVSKIQAGQLELDVTDFLLRETIEQACAVSGLQAEAKSITLELKFDEQVPLRARGDGRRLHQVLLNLVSNAVKFTADGGVVVLVSARRGTNGGSGIRAEITDTGIGIAPGSLERMFEPFTQADASTTRNYGGTGLGLAIARELVALMGGTIGCESTPGQGCTFWFELYLAAPVTDELSPPAPRKVRVATAGVGPAAPLVLVAEDSIVNQIVAVRALERGGCRSHVAANGREALAVLANLHVDAVLMDCQMPVLDGYETTMQLRRSETGDDHVPVIAMTANAMPGDLEKCLEAGMDDYIAKPMRYDVLIEKLRRWVPALALLEEGPAEDSPPPSAPFVPVSH